MDTASPKVARRTRKQPTWLRSREDFVDSDEATAAVAAAAQAPPATATTTTSATTSVSTPTQSHHHHHHHHSPVQQQTFSPPISRRLLGRGHSNSSNTSSAPGLTLPASVLPAAAAAATTALASPLAISAPIIPNANISATINSTEQQQPQQVPAPVVPVTCPHCQKHFSFNLEVGSGGGIEAVSSTSKFNDLSFVSDIRVLAVDDDSLSRTILLKLLKKSGYKATVMSSGADVLRELEASPDQYDIMLCDVVMPEMDGHQLLSKLKADPVLQKIPVIMMSANEQTADVFRCIQAGAEDYLVKPIQMDALKNIWQHVWRKRNQIMFLSLLQVEQQAKKDLVAKMHQAEKKLSRLKQKGRLAKTSYQNTLDRHQEYEMMLTHQLNTLNKQSDLILNHFRTKMTERSIGVQCDLDHEEGWDVEEVVRATRVGTSGTPGPAVGVGVGVSDAFESPSPPSPLLSPPSSPPPPPDHSANHVFSVPGPANATVTATANAAVTTTSVTTTSTLGSSLVHGASGVGGPLSSRLSSDTPRRPGATIYRPQSASAGPPSSSTPLNLPEFTNNLANTTPTLTPTPTSLPLPPQAAAAATTTTTATATSIGSSNSFAHNVPIFPLHSHHPHGGLHIPPTIMEGIVADFSKSISLDSLPVADDDTTPAARTTTTTTTPTLTATTAPATSTATAVTPAAAMATLSLDGNASDVKEMDARGDGDGDGDSIAVSTSMSNNQILEETIVCRICEEPIRESLLQEHSAICHLLSAVTMRISWCEDRLKRIADALRTQRSNILVRELHLSDEVPDIDGVLGVIDTTMAFAKRVMDGSEPLSETFDAIQLAQPLRAVTHPAVRGRSQRIESVIQSLVKNIRELRHMQQANPRALPVRSASVASLSESSSSLKVRTLNFDDFEKIKPISQGGYGRVILASKKKTGDLYALKIISRKSVQAKNFMTQIKAERNIMAFVSSNPWVVRLYSSFQTPKSLCLVMEYLNGGDCESLLQNMGYLSEEHARFYIAETAMAIHSLHQAGITHQDIKPDNMVIASDGHIKLTDFGLSRMAGDKRTGGSWNPSSKLAGTPDYIAPEVLLGVTGGAAGAVDWWALGVVLYEFLVGAPPFNSSNHEEIFNKIIQRKLVWPPVPEEMSREAQDLINQLLTTNPNDRIRFDGLVKHPFFAGIDWSRLREMEPPFVPDNDCWYFEERNSAQYPPLGDNEFETSSVESQPVVPDVVKGSLSQSDSSDIDSYNFNFLNLRNLEEKNKDVLVDRRCSTFTSSSGVSVGMSPVVAASLTSSPVNLSLNNTTNTTNTTNSNNSNGPGTPLTAPLPRRSSPPSTPLTVPLSPPPNTITNNTATQ